jgi:hypothetical protein
VSIARLGGINRDSASRTITENLCSFLGIQMDTRTRTLQTLFCQLGLADDAGQIDAFIELHSPLPSNISLAESCFWNESPAAFLAETIEEDSDWCGSVDKLNCLLREQ